MDELTLDQAKEALQFQSEVMQGQTMEIGNLNTEKISMSVSINQKNKRIKELEEALQNMVDATEGKKDAK